MLGLWGHVRNVNTSILFESERSLNPTFGDAVLIGTRLNHSGHDIIDGACARLDCKKIQWRPSGSEPLHTRARALTTGTEKHETNTFGHRVAVLASMLFAPHLRPWFLDIWGDKWGSYWWTYYPLFVQHFYYSYNTHRTVSDVLWSSFFVQTAFVAVLAAVVVNLLPRRPRK